MLNIFSALCLSLTPNLIEVAVIRRLMIGNGLLLFGYVFWPVCYHRKVGTANQTIMTINAGSSSIKIDLFNIRTERLLQAKINNIGQPNTRLIVQKGSRQHSMTVPAKNHTEAIHNILDSISKDCSPEQLAVIGHRVVHGGTAYINPVIVTDQVITNLQSLDYFDPEHTRAATYLMEIMAHNLPATPQIACFDTAFYQDLPHLAKLLPLPRKLATTGLKRYGFHGLSYTYLLKNFQEAAGETAANGRIILAHLGSGSSLTAVKQGKVLDTTMSLTPASGIPMSTRSGDLDPGIIEFLHRQTGITPAEFNHMIHFESGLLGISELSGDMELLINVSDHNRKAADAVDMFCYQVRKAIASLTAVLGGLDSLIFAGGIGENAPVIRGKICDGLDYLGLSVDGQLNQKQAFLISTHNSRVGIHVMHTDEASVIAQQAYAALKETRT